MELSARKMLLSGFTFWVAFVAIGSYFFFTAKKPIRYGIDLVGGTYITLEVQTEEAVKDDLLERMQSISKKLKDAGKKRPVSRKIEDNKIILTFDSDTNARESLDVVGVAYPELKNSLDGKILKLYFPSHIENKIKEEAVARNIDVLRSRIDKLGIGEIPIAPQGERSIVVELPNVQDPAAAKAMIGKPAILEFKLVEATGSSEEEIYDKYDGELPDGMMIVPGKLRQDQFGEMRRNYHLVPIYTDIKGKYLKGARTIIDSRMGIEPAVSFEFKPEGAKRFYDLTSQNIGKPLAAILDNEVVSVATIQSAIGSAGSICGGFTQQQADDLSLLLRSGAFVAPVKFEEERQIGPSLGRESINQGLMSCLIGLALLFIFSLVYYKWAGFFAFIALVFNLILILLTFSWLGATLTLPGIAGMVLTVGMAIDASILIYEKIKEELARGITIHQAVNLGFDGVLRVILDSNITTFIAGIVLYKFGTGPIQGFAVTLMVGIISTLITGLFFLRSIFYFVLDGLGFKNIKI